MKVFEVKGRIGLNECCMEKICIVVTSSMENAIHNFRNTYGGSPYSVVELSSEDIPVMVDK